MSYVDMYELKKRFDFFDFDSADIIKYDKEIFTILKDMC